jgi:predicted RNase H-like nuclease
LPTTWRLKNVSSAGKSVFTPDSTLILLDQPTIVCNPQGQRPVEGIVSSAVSARLGGMQPASISRAEMFGLNAPVWPFLRRFGGPANPLSPAGATLVFETYPVLLLIALAWMLPDSRMRGRLPKYNPQRNQNLFRGRLALRLPSCFDRLSDSRAQRDVRVA